MYAWGTFRIETEVPRGEGEPIRAEPTTYYFNPLYHASGFAYFVPVAAAFLFLKENRRPRAFLILAPMLLVMGMWRGFAGLMYYPEEMVSLLNSVVMALLAGFCVVWLLGERIGHRHRLVTALLAGGIMLGCCALMLVDSAYVFQIVFFGVVSAAVIQSGFIVGAFLSRRRFGPVRFLLGFGVGILSATFVLFFVYYTILMFPYSFFSADLFWMLLVVMLVYAAIYWVGVLPFLILFFVSDFWRQRFAAVTGLRPAKARCADVQDA
jgi:hypothetical protein